MSVINQATKTATTTSARPTVVSRAGAEVVLAQPRGFCAGVDRAIDIVERALELHGAPIYVRHEIVHNRFVVQDLKTKGAIFIDELHEAPKGAIVVFSAHGVSKRVRDEAEQMGLKVFDATCPLVTKVHVEVKRWRDQGREVIMIGHRGHPEVEGTLGQVTDGIYLIETCEDAHNLEVENPDNLAVVTQTTLSVDDASAIAEILRERFPTIVEPKKSDICYATQNRQDAVKLMASECDFVLVVGSTNSSNSNRLREVAERRGVRAKLVDDPDLIDPSWLEGVKRIGVTAGASAPEALVSQVLARLNELGAASVRTLPGVEENVAFPLPRELSRKIAN